MSARRGRVVVVGGGVAAASAATALREYGHEGSITVISEEKTAPYPKPPLSKAYLAGTLAVEDLWLDTADAELVLGEEVIAVDPASARVRLRSGDTMAYDGLIIATGTRARRPVDPSVHVLETRADAERLIAALSRARSVIVVGSGLLAIELASTARARGLDVVLVARAEGLAPRLGALSVFLSSFVRDHGVRIEPGRGRLVSGGVVLEDGRRLEADLVLVAIGSVVNDVLLPASRAPGGGILVDERNRVATGGDVESPIVAAGDVAVRRRNNGALVRDGTWANALAQGAAAAGTLMGVDTLVLDPVPYGWTEAFGIEVKFTGIIPDGIEPETIDGSLESGHALLRWPGAAAAVGYRVPIGRLRRLAAGVESSA